MELVDEAYLRAPQRRPLVVAHGRGRGAADPHFAGVRLFQESRQMQERRLSGAGRRDQRDRLARRKLERGPVEDLDRRIAATIPTLHIIERQCGDTRLIIHIAAPRPDRAWLRARTDRSSPPATERAQAPPLRAPRVPRPVRAVARENRIRKER